ncbi:MAG TPA: prepilin-type N-terminal cleavage/methylation domain-containing protein [Myxococcota bacterium]|nr:prepilin-type N-terminal cleavage/methylation domain-containing protein [Myxococcota bacterium]HND28744.1 prepilin-type N-terminal cleavage/methylation domain-containing protein [Myxococcota bacterium]HNH47015.1 prepilin-type N-terminal cleavage/methylation domain-containing protein [Myxococcota bacterium]
MNRAGFTLLEIMVALVILALAMTVLVESQGAAVMASLESERYIIATELANHKLVEAQLRLEREGFSATDINEAGSFDDMKEVYGDVDLDDLSEYQWAYTIREVDLQIGDIQGAMGDLKDAGLGPPEPAEGEEGSSSEPTDLASMIPGDALGEMLSPYLREIRVVVWWGSDDEFSSDDGCLSCVEIVTHAVNPSGQLAVPQDNPEGQ